jgi:hypothetical protein
MRSLVRRYQNLQPEPKFEQLSFHALVPVPDKVLAAGFDPAGYDWERKHWGCKWGALDIKVQHCPMPKGAKVIYKFKTPDSAPIALFDVVAKDHPALRLILKAKYEGETTSTTTTWEQGVRRV